MKKSNQEIRALIQKERLKHWEVAKELNISDVTFCKKLRNELSVEFKAKVVEAISRILRQDQ